MSIETVTVEKLRKVLVRFNEDYGTNNNNSDKHRLGKILTVIDASIPDPEQRKAVKDIIQNDWYRPSDMHNDFYVHQEVRKMAEALGFELYPTSDEALLPVPANEWNRYKELTK